MRLCAGVADSGNFGGSERYFRVTWALSGGRAAIQEDYGLGVLSQRH